MPASRNHAAAETRPLASSGPCPLSTNALPSDPCGQPERLDRAGPARHFSRHPRFAKLARWVCLRTGLSCSSRRDGRAPRFPAGSRLVPMRFSQSFGQDTMERTDRWRCALQLKFALSAMLTFKFLSAKRSCTSQRPAESSPSTCCRWWETVFRPGAHLLDRSSVQSNRPILFLGAIGGCKKAEGRRPGRRLEAEKWPPSAGINCTNSANDVFKAQREPRLV